MARIKSGFPEENELVLCTVTKVHFHSVFANLDEYNKGGMIHISEVSPGRIRNIRDYVKEGKKVVCKVLKIHPERGHIDLSLRRVTESQRRQKLDDIKQEQKAVKILELAVKPLKKDTKEIYDSILPEIEKRGLTLYSLFEAIVAGEETLEDVGVDKDIAAKLEEVVKDKVKPPEVVISGEFTMQSYDPKGISIIKGAFKEAESIENVELKYKGAGKYDISVKDSNYKDAEKVLKKIVDDVLDYIDEHNISGEFERHEE